MVKTISGVAACALLASTGMGAVTLSDGNTTISLGGTGGYAQLDWIVDGVNHLHLQTFAVQINGGEVKFLEEQDALGFFTNDLNNDGDDDGLSALYNIDGIEIVTRYTLKGGADMSGASDIGEAIQIINKSGETVSVKFFQVVDLDLAGSPDDSLVSLTDLNRAFQTDVIAGITVSETVARPDATASQAGTWEDILAAVQSGELDGTEVVVGPANLAWSFMWEDTNFLNGERMSVQKNKRLEEIEPVPAPGVMALAGLGGLLAAKRRRSAR